ncbi:MAG: hypothetical protein V1648_01640 [Candidatus Aenigmatarchaeota archaeon]
MPVIGKMPMVADFMDPNRKEVYVPSMDMSAVRQNGKWVYVFGEESERPLSQPVNLILSDGAVGDGVAGTDLSIYKKAALHFDDGK